MPDVMQGARGRLLKVSERSSSVEEPAEGLDNPPPLPPEQPLKLRRTKRFAWPKRSGLGLARSVLEPTRMRQPAAGNAALSRATQQTL